MMTQYMFASGLLPEIQEPLKDAAEKVPLRTSTKSMPPDVDVRARAWGADCLGLVWEELQEIMVIYVYDGRM